jgi:UDP-N-acetylmuramyl pentapeptide phosphotransferase/UDP-N-acetylglucosamine-1-phosphate transferase
MLSLTAIGFVAFLAGDKTIMSLSIITLSSIFGFFIWNYPRGQIFLGDGGAYLIGFWVAALSVGLTVRHENISPWFPLVSNAYPIFETLFSIYRRKIHQGRSPGMPDRLHLHGLVYRRLVSHQGKGSSNRFLNKNAKTSIYIWVLSGFTSCFSVAFRYNTPALIFISILFCSIYLWLYKNLIIFKAPKWLKF